MIRFYKTPWITRLWYPELIWSIPSDDTIYLTFDDGPYPEVTEWVLSELKKANAKATFFCLGKNLEENPEIGRRIIKEGHRMGNHTYSHLKGWKVSESSYMEDVKLCDEVMNEEGVECGLFRPPYGRLKRSQIKRLEKKIIMWSYLSWDFDPKLNIEKSISQLKRANPGSILVFHDSLRAFENLKIILPEVLTYFRSKGIKFEAIS